MFVKTWSSFCFQGWTKSVVNVNSLDASIKIFIGSHSVKQLMRHPCPHYQGWTKSRYRFRKYLVRFYFLRSFGGQKSSHMYVYLNTFTRFLKFRHALKQRVDSSSNVYYQVERNYIHELLDVKFVVKLRAQTTTWWESTDWAHVI